MTFSPKASVSDGLDRLADRVDPIIAAKFTTDLCWSSVDGHPQSPRSGRRQADEELLHP